MSALKISVFRAIAEAGTMCIGLAEHEIMIGLDAIVKAGADL